MASEEHSESSERQASALDSLHLTRAPWGARAAALSRRPSTMVAAGAIATVLLLLGLHETTRGRANLPNVQSPAPKTPTVPAPASAVEHDTKRMSAVFGNARSFREAVLKLGASTPEAVEIEEALREIFHFGKCRPDDRMLLERDGSNALVRFEYRVSPAAYFEASRAPTRELRARRVEEPIERRRIARGAVITSSLSDALEQVGLGRRLAASFAQAFEGKANFAVSARQGDTFRILVDEERIRGEFFRYGTVHAVEYRGAQAGLLRAFWYEPAKQRGDFYDERGRRVYGSWLRVPVQFESISSRFDMRRKHPILRRRIPHEGVDYVADPGTPVRAAARGRVIFAGRKGPNGILVSIRHPNGYETHYAHLLRIERGIRPGVIVPSLRVIGYLGSTGRSTGPHLHFAVRRKGTFVDPLRVLQGPGPLMPKAALTAYKSHVGAMTAELEQIPIEKTAPAAPAARELASD